MKLTMENPEISIIGIIPQYPKHSQQNIYAKIKMPPLGVIAVLSQISDNPEFKEVYIIDENNYSGPRDFMDYPDHNVLQKNEPSKIAMFYGGMSNSIPRMFSLAKQYKGFGAVTIAGGSHVDALPQDALNSGLDIIVHGEGEETIKEIIVEIIQNGKIKLSKDNLSKIRGISYIDDSGKYVFTGKREPIKDLDKFKDTDITLIKFLKKRWSAIPVNKGRGCNWNCEFCVVNKQYGKYKCSTVDKAMRQIMKYSDLGYKYFFFTDDNFCQNIPETIELCKKIGEYKRKFNKKIQLIVQARSEIAENDNLLEAMKFAGVSTIAIGYESPINEELKAMNKGVTVEKLIERSRKISEHFYIHGMFIFGYPTFKDSINKSNLTLKEKFKRYSKFFKSAKIDTIQILNAVPLPGTELRTKLENEGRLFPKEMVDWDKYDGLFLCYDPTPEGIDPYELQNLPKLLMKKRYLGGFFNRNINYANWINWTYNATIGFPINYSYFYLKQIMHDNKEKRRGDNITQDNIKETRNINHNYTLNAWRDVKKSWRNLAIKTYAGGIVRRWLKEYKNIDYSKKLEVISS